MPRTTRSGLDGSVGEWADTLTDWSVDLGFDTFIFWPTTSPRAQLERFAREVVPAVRDRVAERRRRADADAAIAAPDIRRQPVSSNSPTRLVPPVGERDHIQGPENAAVTLVQYGDFECPYCLAAVPIVQELQGLLGDQLRFVFRHFPLTALHPHAQHAAEAAEAAAAEGKFFEMHAALFAHQDALDDKDLGRYAADLGIDPARVRDALRAHTHASRVLEDVESGLASGVRGTPTFYLDDVRYDGNIGVRQFLAAIRDTHPDVVGDVDGQIGRRTIPRVVSQRSLLRP